MTLAAAKRFRILVSEAVDRAGLDILRTVADVDVKTKLSEEQLCEIMNDYDALMVRSGTRVTKRIIQNGRRLKIIGRAGVGVDNVDVDAATSRGIFVVNSPQGNTVAAAEHTIALMFALARKITVADVSLRSLKWEREKFMGCQLQHKTLGIIGLGQVGSHVAKLCREIGMDIICYDPYVNVAKAQSLGCRVTDLAVLLAEADVITLHVPLVPATNHLINQEAINQMKSTCMLVNCARGGVVDDEALCRALRDGRLGGAALDVFESEGVMEEDSPLLSTPNLVLTPHLGASTREAQVNVAVDVAQQIRSTLLGCLPNSAVNIPGLRAAELADMRPFIECCEVLGRVAVQLLPSPLEQIVVGLEGSLASIEKPDVLLMAAANGAIGVHTAARVNFVNVRQIAEKHRIKMVLIKDEDVVKGSVTVEVRSGLHSAHIRGTLTEDNDVLLTSFDGIPIYMILACNRPANDGSDDERTTQATLDHGVEEYKTKSGKSAMNLLYSRHDDVPGVLADITGVLAEANVNIGDCHLGRDRAGTTKAAAIAIFLIDGEFPAEIASDVEAISAVHACKVLEIG